MLLHSSNLATALAALIFVQFCYCTFSYVPELFFLLVLFDYFLCHHPFAPPHSSQFEP
ncbi:hypothetical protein RchiOBHm_Chr7g0210091 [Rosa chinensis]|uniref:Uncharacterized protein n=1 Tax=Rosa chinensis TaxID=74649 RepID=A0A2P6PA49_ROSCH|nr:hypothetical protein RchiOBHm_Chr7g0210091 [Rosa chinensis]